MADADLPSGTDDEGKPDSGDPAFKKAIDNVFKKVARRGREHAEDAALRGRDARKRADDAKRRQTGRKPDRRD